MGGGEGLGNCRRLQIDQQCIEAGERRSDSFFVGANRVSFLGANKTSIAHLFTPQTCVDLPTARYARLGQAPSGFTE